VNHNEEDEMTDATHTLTTYVVQFRSITNAWITTADGAFINATEAADWIRDHIPDHASRIIRRTITDEVVVEREKVA
jgi:hypothetical protein